MSAQGWKPYRNPFTEAEQDEIDQPEDREEQLVQEGRDMAAETLALLRRETQDLQRLADAYKKSEPAIEAFWRSVDALPPDRRAEFEAFRRFLEMPLERPSWLSPPPPDEAIEAAARRMGWLS